MMTKSESIGSPLQTSTERLLSDSPEMQLPSFLIGASGSSSPIELEINPLFSPELSSNALTTALSQLDSSDEEISASTPVVHMSNSNSLNNLLESEMILCPETKPVINVSDMLSSFVTQLDLHQSFNSFLVSSLNVSGQSPLVQDSSESTTTNIGFSLFDVFTKTDNSPALTTGSTSSTSEKKPPQPRAYHRPPQIKKVKYTEEERKATKALRELKRITRNNFNEYAAFSNAIQQHEGHFDQHDLLSLGAITENDEIGRKYYFVSNNDSKENCKQFMTAFFNQENSHQLIVKSLIDKIQNISESWINPANVSFVNIHIKNPHTDQINRQCVIAFSSYEHFSPQLKALFNQVVNELNQSNTNYKFSILHGADDRISQLIKMHNTDMPARVAMRSCSEKYFIALLVKLFARYGRDMQVHGTTNCFLFDYDPTVKYGSNLETRADGSALKLIDRHTPVTEDNYFQNMEPYDRGQNILLQMELTNNRSFNLATIPCCSNCSCNRRAVIEKILPVAQNYNQGIDNPDEYKTPTSPLLTSFVTETSLGFFPAKNQNTDPVTSPTTAVTL